MYGRADGMPSFQLTVAVRASFLNLTVYKQDAVAAGAPFNQLRWMCLMAAEYVKRQVQSDSRLSLALLALDLQFETSVCCMLFVLSSVAFAEASLLPSRDSMSTRWVTPFSPASKRSGLVLLLALTGGVGYLTISEWRDRRLREQEKRETRRTPKRR